jgi:ABC-type sugar transport system substrate-binding protein
VATINDVAARAGVSPTTVSRVFARPELVHIDTRQRVIAVAQQLGYTPNRLARSLAMGRSGNIGLVVPDIANPFFPPLIKAVQQQARLATTPCSSPTPTSTHGTSSRSSEPWPNRSTASCSPRRGCPTRKSAR